jgi:hypothetical protein
MATREPTAMEKKTFGINIKIDDEGNPIETGRGSKFNAAPNQLGLPGWKSRQDIEEGK